MGVGVSNLHIIQEPTVYIIYIIIYILLSAQFLYSPDRALGDKWFREKHSAVYRDRM